MATSPLETTVRGDKPAIVIDLRGEINGTAADSLNSAYDEASGQSPSTIVLNFNDVVYINSTGIALIVNVLARSRQDGRSMVAYGLTDHYKEIFDITHLSDFIKIYDDEASAVSQAAPA